MASIVKTFDFDYALAPFSAEKTAPAPSKSFWARFAQAVIDSRMRAAEREIQRYAHIIRKVEADQARKDR